MKRVRRASSRHRVNSSSNWSTTTSAAGSAPARAVSSWASGSAPGVRDTADPPSAGSRPASTSDDLPLPEGPSTARKGCSVRRSTSRTTSASRPKKNARSSAPKGDRPRNGWRPSYAGGSCPARAPQMRSVASRHSARSPRGHPRDAPERRVPGLQRRCDAVADEAGRVRKSGQQDRCPVRHQRRQAVEAVPDLGAGQRPVAKRIAEQGPPAQAAVQRGHRASSRSASRRSPPPAPGRPRRARAGGGRRPTRAPPRSRASRGRSWRPRRACPGRAPGAGPARRAHPRPRRWRSRHAHRKARCGSPRVAPS